MSNQDQALIFELSREGRIGYSLPELDVPEIELGGPLVRHLYS